MLNVNLFNHQKVVSFFSDRTLGNIDFRFGSKNGVINQRQKMAAFAGATLSDFYEMEQVHGSRVEVIKKKPKKNTFPQTDALITNLKNVFLMVKTADCFPLLFFSPNRKVIAICHVGWRGAIEKIFLKTLLIMIDRFACQPAEMEIIIGPGIRKCCFKHKHLLQEKLPEWKEFIEEKEREKTLDMPAFIIHELKAVGIRKENIRDMKLCTVCDKHYFSHFRSLRQNEPEGRFATIIGLKEDGS